MPVNQFFREHESFLWFGMSISNMALLEKERAGPRLQEKSMQRMSILL